MLATPAHAHAHGNARAVTHRAVEQKSKGAQELISGADIMVCTGFASSKHLGEDCMEYIHQCQSAFLRTSRQSVHVGPIIMIIIIILILIIINK